MIRLSKALFSLQFSLQRRSGKKLSRCVIVTLRATLTLLFPSSKALKEVRTARSCGTSLRRTEMMAGLRRSVPATLSPKGSPFRLTSASSRYYVAAMV